MSGLPSTQASAADRATERSGLHRLIPNPRMLDVDHVVLQASPERVWQKVRHLDLASSRLVRALFAIRTLPSRLAGETLDPRVRLDDLASSSEHPGFQILIDDPPREVAAGAIGKVWHLRIPFVHVDGAEAFAAFAEPDFVKVAWAIRVIPASSTRTHVEFELRVDATTDEAWRKFRRYYRVIGPGSHFIRRVVLSEIVRAFNAPEAR